MSIVPFRERERSARTRKDIGTRQKFHENSSGSSQLPSFWGAGRSSLGKCGSAECVTEGLRWAATGEAGVEEESVYWVKDLALKRVEKAPTLPTTEKLKGQR